MFEFFFSPQNILYNSNSSFLNKFHYLLFVYLNFSNPTFSVKKKKNTLLWIFLQLLRKFKSTLKKKIIRSKTFRYALQRKFEWKYLKTLKKGGRGEKRKFYIFQGFFFFIQHVWTLEVRIYNSIFNILSVSYEERTFL